MATQAALLGYRRMRISGGGKSIFNIFMAIETELIAGGFYKLDIVRAVSIVAGVAVALLDSSVGAIELHGVSEIGMTAETEFAGRCCQ